ncbi:Slit 2 protein like [Actinidia chinensis var. chinensis]|uniref:Slit 2 protein like n=1 Tax=Actinidia chinensis var. chinensis TaxID=1590841 RepID=A0A2R6PKB0_ACTCC|nr:Slit 2 protein like [Actinidia chinensis var. chinensis]
MASAASIAAVLANLLLLLLQPWTTTASILSPILSPVLDGVCKEVECGKGTCKPSLNSTLLFECECDRGWKQSRPDDDNDLKFLPCVIPNCTLDYSCSEAAPPVQDKESRSNKSILDPCHWSDCGGGTCNKTSAFTYKCECREGYYNLLKVDAFPCFRECAIGMDCAGLGITLTNKSTSPTPGLADNGTNQASSIPRGNTHWLIIVSMVLATLLWKLN